MATITRAEIFKQLPRYATIEASSIADWPKNGIPATLALQNGVTWYFHLAGEEKDSEGDVRFWRYQLRHHKGVWTIRVYND